MSTASRAALTALLLLASLSLRPAIARHGPPLDETYAPRSTDGAVYELDRRSHPALTGGWDALRRGEWLDPNLAALPALQGARLLHDGGDWALLWMIPEQAEDLQACGVRLGPPRPRPSVVPGRSLPENLYGARSLTTLQSLAAAVNIDQMMMDLNAIATDIQTRYYNTTGMQAATQYVLDRFSEYGLDNAYFDSFAYNGYTIRNVIGVKTGTLYPSQIYLICGHLDSTSQQAQTLAPGAEDNGSGSVGVLEAARLLGPLPTDATLYFVCFTAEEQGLIGSEHLAQIADQQNWDLRGVLNMDMVGYDLPGPPDIWIEGFPGNPGSVALLDLLEDVANTYTDMTVYRYPDDGFGSDHVPFNDHGFPASLSIDYDWDSYACYHRTCDVVGNIVQNQFRRMVVTVTIAGAELAGLSSDLGSVEGIADRTDSADDSGILIEVVGTGYTPATSGPGGVFTLPDLLPGGYTLRASAQGYETVEEPVTIVDGEVTRVRIPLDPVECSVVRGSVSLQGGGDPGGALVFAEGQSPVGVADATGAYDLEPIYPGLVVLSANYPGQMPVAKAIDVPSGQVLTGVDFLLKPVWTFEESAEGLAANLGWQWGSDALTGAHSGTNVWGTKLGGNYENCSDYRLDFPPLDLRFYEAARLHFWQWYKTQATYDGGNIQVSTDRGVTWTVVTPVGGYSGQLRGSCNPLAGQPGYGGTQTTWTEAVVDLGAYVGRSIRVRFWFGSDGSVRDRGWYVDDVSLEGTLDVSSVVERGTQTPSLGSRISVQPNPFASGTTVQFQVGVTGPTWVAIFDATGRKVRALAEAVPLAAGRHVFTWDGVDDGGRRVPAGIYWVRVSANGRTQIQPMTLLR